MADFNIRRKTGSLALRVATISILFLVIPLILQSLFLYRQEYREKLKDVEQTLNILASERAGLVQEIIQKDWAVLDVAAPNIRQQKQIVEISMPQGAGDHFAIVNPMRDSLWVGIRESSGKALAIAVPYSNLIEELATEKDSPYPIRLALLDAQGKILAESIKVRAETGLLKVHRSIEGTDISLELTIPESLIEALHQQNYYARFAMLLLFVGLIGGGAVFLLTRRVAKPLAHLQRTMARVADGGIHVRYTPDWMGFEINQLGKQFNQTLDDLNRHSQEMEREKIAREKLAEELRIGHEIQKSLLPTHLPDFPGLDVATGYLPAREVSGDFYDLFPIGQNKLLIAIADTAGKGISACLYSLGLRSMIRALASTSGDLAEIVMRANDLFWIDARNSGMFVTLWLGIYDSERHLLTYCSQGHPPALLRRNSEIKELWTGGIALGAQQLDAVPTAQIHLAPNDLLLLYTDGIIEAHNLDQQLYGAKRLKEFFHQKKSPRSLADNLLEEIKLFSQGVPQHDDIAFIAIKTL